MKNPFDKPDFIRIGWNFGSFYLEIVNITGNVTMLLGIDPQTIVNLFKFNNVRHFDFKSDMDMAPDMQSKLVVALVAADLF